MQTARLGTIFDGAWYYAGICQRSALWKSESWAAKDWKSRRLGLAAWG
jgi:hypothetical protein